MKGKLVFILGAAVGYVLGARAGRERYEQIKRGAQTVWQTPPVQRGAELVREAVDVKVTELKSAAVAFGSQVIGSVAQRGQTSAPDAQAPKVSPKPETKPTARSASATKRASTNTAATGEKAAATTAPKSATKSTAKRATQPAQKPAAKKQADNS